METIYRIKTKARACPFCGSEAIIVADNWEGNYRYIYVFCEECACKGPEVEIRITKRFNEDSIEEAVKNWNKRESAESDAVDLGVYGISDNPIEYRRLTQRIIYESDLD